MILEEAAEALEDSGYEIMVASSVASAIQILKVSSEDIELILTDLKMQGATGADLVKYAKGMALEIPFIIMSGHASPNIQENGIDLSSYAFLRKPLQIESLIEKVHLIIDAKE